MTLKHRFAPDRRALLTGALALSAGAALPAFADEAETSETTEAKVDLAERGYALGDVVLGDPDAPVEIIEYASLTCPHCAHFHTDTLPAIKADYIDTGKAKLILREVFFDQFGLWSVMIARCGGEAGYYGLIGKYLERQGEWYSSHVRAFNDTHNAQPMIDDMMKIGRLGGLSDVRMNECLSDQDFLERLVEDFKTTTSADDVSSTPTFFINGERVQGAVSAAVMAEVIERQLVD